MSASEFPLGISSVQEGHFGGGSGGTGYFAQPKAAKSANPDSHGEPEAEDQSEESTQPLPDPMLAEEPLDPIYELPGSHEHHPHVGRVLDVRA